MIRGEVNVQRVWLSLVGRDCGAWVHALRVGGKPVSAELFGMIPEEPLAGEPLGWVNVHGEKCAGLGEHLHLLWVNAEGEPRVATVKREPRWDHLRHLHLGC